MKPTFKIYVHLAGNCKIVNSYEIYGSQNLNLGDKVYLSTDTIPAGVYEIYDIAKIV